MKKLPIPFLLILILLLLPTTALAQETAVPANATQQAERLATDIPAMTDAVATPVVAPTVESIETPAEPPTEPPVVVLDPAPDFSVETVILIVCAVLFLIVVVFGAVLTAILVPILKGQPEIVKASIRAGYETGVKQATDIVEKTPSPVDNLLLEEINKVVRNMLTEAGILPQKSPVDGAP